MEKSKKTLHFYDSSKYMRFAHGPSLLDVQIYSTINEMNALDMDYGIERTDVLRQFHGQLQHTHTHTDEYSCRIL